MSEREGARFCGSCQHEVADLTRATDGELLKLFNSEARPKCARFDVRQLDRVLSAPQGQRARLLPIAAFTTLIAVLTGCETLAQGEPMVIPDTAHVPDSGTRTLMGDPRPVEPSMAPVIPDSSANVPLHHPMTMGEIDIRALPPQRKRAKEQVKKP